MTNVVLRAAVWCRRLAHCRGFGIQSPTDYRFVRDVVLQTLPYYAYESLDKGNDWLTSSVGRLCLRTANFRQPHTFVCREPDMTPYLKAGCQKAREASPNDSSSAELVVESLDEYYDTAETATFADGTILFLTRTHENRSLWRSVMRQTHAICFDLYYCGIFFFSRQRTPQHYIVNF